MTRVNLATVVAARARGGDTVFGWLEVGDRFSFTGPSPPVVYTKGKGGWFTDLTGRAFRTGAGSAVNIVEKAAGT